MSSDYQRLSVNINAESAAILRSVTRDQSITVTEAIRRAIGLLGFMEAARAHTPPPGQGALDEAEAEIAQQAREQREWEAEWMSLTPEERQAEIELMDQHVRFTAGEDS